MKNRILALFLGFIVLLLSACGKTGPLTLPDDVASTQADITSRDLCTMSFSSENV